MTKNKRAAILPACGGIGIRGCHQTRKARKYILSLFYLFFCVSTHCGKSAPIFMVTRHIEVKSAARKINEKM